MSVKGDWPRRTQVSLEELYFRWDYAEGKYPNMSPEEANVKIAEIRKLTGKP